MVSNPSATPVGPGRIKLVQVLDGTGPAPIPEGTGWGELGICEICLHVRDLEAVHERLAALPGGGTLMAPLSGAVVPYDVSLDISYVHDPWGGKIEMIEWTGLWKSLPGRAPRRGREPRRVRRRRHGREPRVLPAPRLRRDALRVDRLLRSDGALVRPRAARAAHGHDDVHAGRRHRADAADAARPRLPRRVGTPRPDGVRGRRRQPRARVRAARGRRRRVPRADPDASTSAPASGATATSSTRMASTSRSWKDVSR